MSDVVFASKLPPTVIGQMTCTSPWPTRHEFFTRFGRFDFVEGSSATAFSGVPVLPLVVESLALSDVEPGELDVIEAEVRVESVVVGFAVAFARVVVLLLRRPFGVDAFLVGVIVALSSSVLVALGSSAVLLHELAKPATMSTISGIASARHLVIGRMAVLPVSELIGARELLRHTGSVATMNANAQLEQLSCQLCGPTTLVSPCGQKLRD